MVRFLMALFVAVVASSPAAAGNTSFSFGISSGGHSHHGRHWGPRRHHGWGYPHYRPRTVFLYSAPVYRAPVYLAPPPVAYYPPTVSPTGPCRSFNGDASIDGSGRPFYGRACLLADGRWHIVQ